MVPLYRVPLDKIVVGSNRIKYEDIKVSHVKSLILSEKNISYSPDNLNLWKVDRDSVEKNDALLETFSTKDDIKEKLGGDLMQPRLHLDEYFNKNSFKDKKSKTAIHIIVQLLTAVSNPFRDSNSILKWIQEYSPVTGRQLFTLVETFGARFTLCGRDDTIETLWNGGGTGQPCGPGTGKSRFLQELVNIIRDKALNSGDQDIMSILGNAVLHMEMEQRHQILTSFAGFRDKIGQEYASGLTLSLVLRTIYLSKLEEDKNINE
ncbi:hypothetical protein C1646_754098 [Rhizophagus diaphanus]|nr:hypothetical protein C1646_754098 [Rhizophagus diaphanus] [Rhizophagus sp. MUCL 43196]